MHKHVWVPSPHSIPATRYHPTIISEVSPRSVRALKNGIQSNKYLKFHFPARLGATDPWGVSTPYLTHRYKCCGKQKIPKIKWI